MWPDLGFRPDSMEGGPWDGNYYTCALFCEEWDSQSKIEKKRNAITLRLNYRRTIFFIPKCFQIITLVALIRATVYITVPRF